MEKLGRYNADIIVYEGRSAMNTLERAIIEYQEKGWMLVSQVENTAQIRKPKHFGFGRFLLCLVIVPAPFLLLDYWMRKTPMKLLTCDGQGNVKVKTLSW
jgi:hypothetical protein